MKADMDRKQYVPPSTESSVNTELALQDTLKSCIKADCHSVVAASMRKDLDSLAGAVASNEPISLGAGHTEWERLPEEPTGDVAGTEQSTWHANEQHQQIHRNTVGAHTQIGTETNANNACAQIKTCSCWGLERTS